VPAAQQLDLRDFEVDLRLPKSLEKIPGDFPADRGIVTVTSTDNIYIYINVRTVFREPVAAAVAVVVVGALVRSALVRYVSHRTAPLEQRGLQPAAGRVPAQRVAPLQFARGRLPAASRRQLLVVRVTCERRTRNVPTGAMYWSRPETTTPVRFLKAVNRARA